MSAKDELGRFVMANLRDKALDHADLTLKGHWKTPSLQTLQDELARLDDHQRNVARRLVRSVVDAAIHDFLFAIQEQSDVSGWPRILVDGVDVANTSDGLHGEPFGPDGWQAKFSRFGEPPEEA